MRQRLPIKRSNTPSPATSASLISTIRSYLPGVWIAPKNNELVTLYRLRYKMALEEQKYDTALIFLNKILELDPVNVEAKLCKGEIYYHCLNDYPQAIEHFNKVIRLTASQQEDPTHLKAREAMSEIMELLS